MVADWKNGQTYDLHVKVTQTASDLKSSTFDVIEATDETVEAEPEEAPAPAAKPKAPKPSVVVAKY